MKLTRRNKKGNDIIIVTSWDDGASTDIRIVQLLLEYQLPGIFYLPALLIQDTALDYIGIYKNFEIGSHTINHPELTHIEQADALAEIVDSKIILEQKFLGKEIKSFCYPKGRYNKKIKNMVIEAGYKEARTVDVLNTEIPIDPFITKPTIHVHPNRREYKNEKWVVIAKRKIDEVFENGGYFHLWGHSWEVEKFNLWFELEDVLKYLHNKFFNLNY